MLGRSSVLLLALCQSVRGEGFALDTPKPIPEVSLDCADTADGHFECGRQLGAHFKELIKEAFAADSSLQNLYREVTGTKADTDPPQSAETASLRDVFTRFVRIHEDRYPLLMQEVRGMAAGSGQPLDLVLCGNFRQELQTAAATARSDKGPLHGVPDACTDVLVVDEASGIAGITHNEDYDALFFDTIYLVRQTWRQPQARGHRGPKVGATNDTVQSGPDSARGEQVAEAPESVSYVSFTYPGVLPGWAPGWNSHGVVMSWNVLYPSEMRAGGGVAVAFVCRDVLGRARDADEAIALAAPEDLALGQNLNVGVVAAAGPTSVGGLRALVKTIETAPSGEKSVKRVDSETGAVFHANEYLRMSDIPQVSASLVSSQHRRAAFERTEPKPTSLTAALQVLGDTSDAKYPIFRREDATGEDTLFTVGFDLVEGVVAAYRDNPRLGEKAVALWEPLWRSAASSIELGLVSSDSLEGSEPARTDDRGVTIFA